LRPLTNEQFLDLKLLDFGKLEVFDTHDKQKLQKAILVLRKEQRTQKARTKDFLTNAQSPRSQESGDDLEEDESFASSNNGNNRNSSSSSSSIARNTDTDSVGRTSRPRYNVAGVVGARKKSINAVQQQQQQQQHSEQRRRASISSTIDSDKTNSGEVVLVAHHQQQQKAWQKNNLVSKNVKRNLSWQNNNNSNNNNNCFDEDNDPRIRVVVRARPMAPREIAKSESIVCDADPDLKTLTVFEPKVKVDLTKYTETSEFVFDDVFGGFCSDDRVYGKTVGPLVRSVLCGGNATCFAYGQTGSGKTYTMAPLPMRAAKELLDGFAEFNKVLNENQRLKKKKEKDNNNNNEEDENENHNEDDDDDDSEDDVNIDRKIELWVSAYEIYGGKVYDLLAAREKLRVLEDAKNQMQIVGLSEFHCENVVDVETLIERSALERCVGQTGANSESSRSHAVIQLCIKERLIQPKEGLRGRQTSIYQRHQHQDMINNGGIHNTNNCKRYHRKPLGKFSFIDLAGSERGADTTDTDRQTRAEGAEINKSLLALKECIRALDGGALHVPFRGSKLTEVLRDSFLGDSRTVMIACVSPAAGSCEHTLNTLRYADRVKELRSNGTMPSSSSSNNNNNNNMRKASFQGERSTSQRQHQTTTSSPSSVINGLPTKDNKKQRPAFDLSFCSTSLSSSASSSSEVDLSEGDSSLDPSSSLVEKTSAEQKILAEKKKKKKKKKEEEKKTKEDENTSRTPILLPRDDTNTNTNTLSEAEAEAEGEEEEEEEHARFEKYAKSLSPRVLQQKHEKLIETILKEEFDLIDAHRLHVEQSVSRASQAAELLRVVDEPGSAVDEYCSNLSNALERQQNELLDLRSKVKKFQRNLRKEDCLSKLATTTATTTTSK